jgi:signal transduction histidine kinase
MHTLTIMHVCLAGFFAFAAIHYAIQWWFSRSERVLLAFAVQTCLSAVVCVLLASFFRATTIPETQAALDRFVTVGVLVNAAVLHFYTYLAGRRDRGYRATVTAALIFLAVLNQWAPLRGTVLELRTMQLADGATRLLPIRTPAGASLALMYVVVLAVHAYGAFVVRKIWTRDRAGAVLLGVGIGAMLAGMTLGFLIDFAKVRVPYAGAWPNVVFVLCAALFLAREYAARGARLGASERRAAASLLETQVALSNLQAEERRREEAEAARHQALEAMVQAQRAELSSQLAAGVAHDFNNVLNVISMWSSVVLGDSGQGPDEERARRALAAAQQQGHALSQQLMSLARPESRSVTRFPLHRPIAKTVQTLAAALPRGTSVASDAAVAPEVEADEAEVQQVIYNLVLNARDAMPDGGSIQVSAGLETSPTPILVVGGSLAPGRWATLAVADTGPGIEPAIRDRIFDLFFTTKQPGRGTGLGLATVLRIAKISGGGVALETQPGHGATFKVYLPCV